MNNSVVYGLSLLGLCWVLITLLTYGFSLFVYRRTGRYSLLHPLIGSALLLYCLLNMLSIPIAQYQQYTHWLSWALGPVTVALAVPLYNQLAAMRQLGKGILLPVFAGGICAAISAYGVMVVCNASNQFSLSILSKSITTPLAMETTAVIGGLPGLAAVIVVVTGIFSVLISNLFFRLMKIKSDVVKGVTLGTIAHAIGTAKAYEMSEQQGAFSTLALCVNGVFTAVSLPFVLWQLQGL